MNKITSLFFVAAALAASAPDLSAGQAQVHLYSLSLRFQPATAKSQGLNYGLELTSDTPTSLEPNGELAPLPSGAPSSHGSFYRLTGDIFFEPVFGTFLLNVPAPVDQNTNGVADFFEISQAVESTTTNGAFDDIEQTGKVTTTWSRAAGSSTGNCRLTMVEYGLTFNATIEIQEYRGVLKYATSETNVTGTVMLTNAVSATRTLSGPVLFEKNSTNELNLRPGAWTNEKAQSVQFQGAPRLLRDGSDYFDIFTFNDGDLSTSADDYFVWLIQITDPNDSDRNGIPDLSDAPVPRLPSLAVARSGTNLLLSLSADLGKTVQVERIAALGSTNWTLAASLTVTNDPQAVQVPLPTNAAAFWRLRLP